MLVRHSHSLCLTVLTKNTNVFGLYLAPAPRELPLGSYWMHFPPSQLRIPESFPNLGAHAKFFVLTKLLQIPGVLPKPVARLWPIKLRGTSKRSCLAKATEAPGTGSGSLWEAAEIPAGCLLSGLEPDCL